MAEKKEDFSAVTNNNDRNNFFALPEPCPPARPPALFRQLAAAVAQPFLLLDFTRISATAAAPARHNDITCQNATVHIGSPSVIELRSATKP